MFHHQTIHILFNGTHHDIRLGPQNVRQQQLIADMKARLELYAHLAQSQDDIKLGRVQLMDKAFDELFEEIGKAEL